MFIIEIVVLTLVLLVIASITDLQKREVPDYVSYALMILALGGSAIYSIVAWTYVPLAQSVMGFLIGMAIANAMFYLGQWGGGDSKLIMGLGAVLGFNLFSLFGETNLWLLIFLVLSIFVGAVYGIFWSIYLAFKHRKPFMASLRTWSNNKQMRIIRIAVLTVLALLSVFDLFAVPTPLKLPTLLIIALVFLTFYLWIFMKIIEESCMIKKLSVSKLTEGDWIHIPIYSKNSKKKLIVGPKDLGISREQIAMLKKLKIRFAIVKEGIPFVPVFLISYVLLLMGYYFGIRFMF